MLIILAGLPGTGKTTLARLLARQLGAVHLRIDSIEQAIRNSGVLAVSLDDAGYGHALPAWADVATRDYHPWDRPHVVVDTAHRTPTQAFEALLTSLQSLP